MSLRRSHVLLIVTIAGILALTLVAVGVFNGVQEPHNVPINMSAKSYVRINISEKGAVYLEFKGAELRAAATSEGLKTAEPVALRMRNSPLIQESPWFTLPIPTDQLPEGISAIKGFFLRDRVMESRGILRAIFKREVDDIDGSLGICRADKQKTIWQVKVDGWTHAGDAPDSAPPMQFRNWDKGTFAARLPSVERVALIVGGVPSNGRLGVRVGAIADGNFPVDGMSKDGKPLPIEVRVLDGAGAEVGTKTGALEDFAFS